jgi:hypothetical protein
MLPVLRQSAADYLCHSPAAHHPREMKALALAEAVSVQRTGKMTASGEKLRESFFYDSESTNAEGVLQLAFCHLRPAFDMVTLGLAVEFVPGVTIGAAGPGDRRPFTAGRGLFGVPAAHGTRAFAFFGCANMRSAFALLLSGSAFGFLALGAVQIAAISAITLIFRGTCFLQCNRDCLPATLDLAGFASAATLKFTMLELMHHPACDALLSGCLRHVGFPFSSDFSEKP